MNTTLKKILAVLIVIATLFGWYVTVFGIGSISSIKDVMRFGLDINGGVYVVMEAETDATGSELKDLMEQTQAVLENRINQMGLAEPTVTTEGEKRIRVELPGVEDAEEAIEQIGRTAQLQFVMADGTVVLDGGNIRDARITTDSEHGGYAVALEFDSEGASLFEQATRDALAGTVTPMNDNLRADQILIVLDNEIISAPAVQSVITNGNAIITAGTTGGFPQDEATTLAALIRGGALPVGLTQINTSIQTATIGENALKMSVIAGAIGLLLVFVIMIIGYSMMGVVASLALALYVVLDLWAIVGMRAVMTLPGIAGLILSVGMAVDANVVIFTRIKEEILNGKTTRAAIHSGFRRAVVTVLDSQITTIIAALVLYQIGTSSVRGFAMTLMLGIILSIFTAVVVTQLYLSLMGDSKTFSDPKYYGIKDGKATFAIRKKFQFIKNRKIFYIASCAIILIGLVSGFFVRGYNMGIDFTGGTMMQLDLGRASSSSEVNEILTANGIDDAQIQFSGDNGEQVIIRTTQSLDNAARTELVDAFKESFEIEDDAVLAVEQFGPSVGDELKSNAIKAVIIATLCMLVYIIIRFEWRFGVAAVAGLVHDVLMVLAFYGIFHTTINNPFIAGILTVVGYSINDTIVVFDRIRENKNLQRRSISPELIDDSVNQTLSRSLVTSLTTLIVMVPLIVMAGSAIREFIVPLFIGVLVGTYSSIFICSPVYYDLTRKTDRDSRRYEAKQAKETEKKEAKAAYLASEEGAAKKAKEAEKKAKEAAKREERESGMSTKKKYKLMSQEKAKIKEAEIAAKKAEEEAKLAAEKVARQAARAAAKEAEVAAFAAELAAKGAEVEKPELADEIAAETESVAAVIETVKNEAESAAEEVTAEAKEVVLDYKTEVEQEAADAIGEAQAAVEAAVEEAMDAADVVETTAGEAATEAVDTAEAAAEEVKAEAEDTADAIIDIIEKE